mmetsp:Transcript_31255/g.72893  ORF Transcript_31255/g.72893 Transcript_31255/m.72893 type:complete len:169 (+) Transcript_31255:145-651(+)
MAMFECNVCLEPASDPVVTKCGHLFCWSCLHQWMHQPRRSALHGGLQSSSGNTCCPVCKALVNEQSIIPVYARGEEQSSRPADPNLPARPLAERTEMEAMTHDPGDGLEYGGGSSTRYSFQAGYGQFPVLCSLACRSVSILDVPTPAGRGRLFLSAMFIAAVISMALM